MTQSDNKPKREKPILMSAWSVQRILAGEKSVTRRSMKPQPPDWCKEFGVTCFTPDGHISGRGTYGDQGPAEKFFKPRYHPGDILWVREAWRTTELYDSLPPRDIPEDAPIEYLADSPIGSFLGRYRPGMFMCRWMSRLGQEVTDVRQEMLGDITDADARLEGISDLMALVGQIENPYRTAFVQLRESIYGTGAWERDREKWVWRYELKLIGGSA